MEKVQQFRRKNNNRTERNRILAQRQSNRSDRLFYAVNELHIILSLSKWKVIDALKMCCFCFQIYDECESSKWFLLSRIEHIINCDYMQSSKRKRSARTNGRTNEWKKKWKKKHLFNERNAFDVDESENGQRRNWIDGRAMSWERFYWTKAIFNEAESVSLLNGHRTDIDKLKLLVRRNRKAQTARKWWILWNFIVFFFLRRLIFRFLFFITWNINRRQLIILIFVWVYILSFSLCFSFLHSKIVPRNYIVNI